jgi:hypothetical protein
MNAEDLKKRPVRNVPKTKSFSTGSRKILLAIWISNFMDCTMRPLKKLIA